jgi:type I restriction enzyme S subunit
VGQLLANAASSASPLSVPAGWDVVRLEDVARFSSGTTPSRARIEEYFNAGRHFWVKTLDLNNSTIVRTDERVTDRALAETSLKVNPAGTVLVAMYGGFQQIGRTGLLAVPAAVNQAITAIAVDRRRLLPQYLLHTLNYCVDYWRSVASSSRKDPNITSLDVRQFPIALPPVSEQRDIVQVLADASRAVELIERLTAKKQAIKQGVLQQMLSGRTRLPGFGGAWSSCRLGDLLAVRHGKSQKGIEAAGGAYPILATGGQIGRTNTPLFSKPSVLIGRKGTIDRPQYQATPFWTVDTLFYTEISAAVDPKFLYYLFTTIDWRSMNEASGVPSLSSSQIEGVEVLMPPAQEQVAIRQVIDDIEADIGALKERLGKSKAIKHGMMQELLTGRTRLEVAEDAA